MCETDAPIHTHLLECMLYKDTYTHIQTHCRLCWKTLGVMQDKQHIFGLTHSKRQCLHCETEETQLRLHRNTHKKFNYGIKPGDGYISKTWCWFWLSRVPCVDSVTESRPFMKPVKCVFVFVCVCVCACLLAFVLVCAQASENTQLVRRQTFAPVPDKRSACRGRKVAETQTQNASFREQHVSFCVCVYQ